MGALKRTFGSGPSNISNPIGPLTPTPIKYLSKLRPLFRSFAIPSARGPAVTIIILPQNCPSLCATLLRTMFLTCRIPQPGCVSSTTLSFCHQGYLLMFTKHALALIPSPLCLLMILISYLQVYLFICVKKMPLPQTARSEEQESHLLLQTLCPLCC